MVGLMETARAAVLTIGTELTTGQIVNTNSAWISSKLVDLGVEVMLHETVADDRPAIREALDRCAAKAEIVFVSGGLGPTSDDFTREVIAEWLGVPLEWHEPSWQQIVQRLGKLGVEVAESNRQQCRFPRGAKVLTNPAGTANAFFAEKNSTNLWVLPGPPSEVAAVWKANAIEDSVRALFPRLAPVELLTWQCLGKSEAALGELTEAALAGSGLRIGYRASRPYVEVKVWVPTGEMERARPFLAKLETAIGPWIVTRQGTDLAAALVKELSAYEAIQILDGATAGALSSRLAPHLTSPAFKGVAEKVVLATEWASIDSPGEWISEALTQADAEALTLAIAGFSAMGEWSLGIRLGSVLDQETLKSPWNDPVRSRPAATEIALQHWLRWLQNKVH